MPTAVGVSQSGSSSSDGSGSSTTIIIIVIVVAVVLIGGVIFVYNRNKSTMSTKDEFTRGKTAGPSSFSNPVYADADQENGGYADVHASNDAGGFGDADGYMDLPAE